MTNDERLTLPEEMMLLVLKDREGTVAFGINYQFALAGSILAELLLREKIRILEGRRKLVELIDAEPTGDPVLDECLDKIAGSKRRAAPKAWVQRFANLKKLKHRVAGSLVEKKILRADEDKVLLIFDRKIYPELDPRPEQRVVDRMRKAIFMDGGSVDARTAILISLAKSSDALKTVFEKHRLKERKERIEKIVNGDLMGKATKEAIEAMQAAVFVACIVPAVVATGH